MRKHQQGAFRAIAKYCSASNAQICKQFTSFTRLAAQECRDQGRFYSAKIEDSEEEQAISKLYNTLSEHSFAIPVQCADNIRFIYQPSEFLNELELGIQRAQKRITLASLYLGTGQHEQKLVRISTCFSKKLS